MTKQKRKIGGIYIHFPFCKVKCGYCDFFSIADKENYIPIFIDSLTKEIEIYFNQNNMEDIQFNSMFLGGGTPSLIPSNDIEKIFKALSKKINLSKLEEITIEANPGESPRGRLKEYRELGINRISFGFQSLDDKLLKFLDRLHTSKDCIKAYNDARSAGFDNINTDMIFNIPNQSLEVLDRNLNEVIRLSPEHISCYSLTVEKGTKLYNQVSNGKVKMPKEDLDYQMYRRSMLTLKNADYYQYEASNYSKKNKECLHNLHYWNLNPYLAFGPSAHGYNGVKRWWNYRSLDIYISSIKNGKLPIDNQEILKNKDHYNEIIMNGLRTSKGINIENLNEIKGEVSFEGMISKWPQLTIKDGYLKLRDNNFMLLDEITSDLFI